MSNGSVWTFIDRLSADDLRALALMLGAPEVELAAVLSRDRLISLVNDYVVLAAGNPAIQRDELESYIVSQVEQFWPQPDSPGLEDRVRRPLLDGVQTVLHLGVLTASADGVVSRPERRFLMETVHMLVLPAADSQRLLHAIPRKAVAHPQAELAALEPALQRLAADPEAMRACLSFVAAVAVVDEVLRRPEIELYYAVSERLGEEHKEAALLLEEVRRGYGDFLQSIDPVAAGALSVPTAAALASALTTGFAPFLTTRTGLKWIGSVLGGSASPEDLRQVSAIPNTWNTWSSMVVALGAAVSLASYRGAVRFDRLLPLLLYRSLVPEPERPAPALPEFTTPPW